MLPKNSERLFPALTDLAIHMSMNANKPTLIYRALLLLCVVYFIAVALAHQLGIKVPVLFVFYDVASERYQDLIISFLAFGWAMLFAIGFWDAELKRTIQIPILAAAVIAVAGLFRAGLEVQGHNEITYEIAGLAILLVALVTAYGLAVKCRR